MSCGRDAEEHVVICLDLRVENRGRMPPPAYIRSSSESSFPSASDSRVEEDFKTGLRRRRLIIFSTFILILFVVSLLLLILNLLIIFKLQIGQQGMRYIRFHSAKNIKTGEEERMVHFTGKTDLGTVVTNGHVHGYPDKDLNAYGSRILISGEENGTLLALQPGSCRLKMADNFQVISYETRRPIFSAKHPMVTIDRKIKKLSTHKIITNKIRSPVDETLRIEVDSASLRGNEGVRLEARNVLVNAATIIALNTSRDGAIRMGGKVRIGAYTNGLTLSPSPALAASVDAFRVCVCNGPKAKIYLTPGNKACNGGHDICAQ